MRIIRAIGYRMVLFLVVGAFVLPAIPTHASGYVFMGFDGELVGQIAEFTFVPDVTFSTTVAETWKISDSPTYITLRGRQLAGPPTAFLILKFATPQDAVSFRFATATSTQLTVRILLGGAEIAVRGFRGEDLGAGFFEGVAQIDGLSFDEIQIGAASDAAIDDLSVGAVEDERLNRVLSTSDGAQTGAVYCRVGGVEVLYSIDGDPREGKRALFVSNRQITRAGIPKTGVKLIASTRDGYAVYRLATGEMQLVGPGLHATPYIYTWDGCASRITIP